MSEMVERVAKAIRNVSGVEATSYFAPKTLEIARAAIEAMREPTDEMIDAMSWNVTRGRAPSHLDEWQAGIDEALK